MHIFQYLIFTYLRAYGLFFSPSVLWHIQYAGQMQILSQHNHMLSFISLALALPPPTELYSSHNQTHTFNPSSSICFPLSVSSFFFFCLFHCHTHTHKKKRGYTNTQTHMHISPFPGTNTTLPSLQTGSYKINPFAQQQRGERIDQRDQHGEKWKRKRVEKEVCAVSCFLTETLLYLLHLDSDSHTVQSNTKKLGTLKWHNICHCTSYSCFL